MILLCVVEIIINVGRLFSYTSRRIHVIPLLILIFGILTLIAPAFLDITTIEDGALGDAFNNYFVTDWETFVQEGPGNVAFNMLFAVLLVPNSSPITSSQICVFSPLDNCSSLLAGLPYSSLCILNSTKYHCCTSPCGFPAQEPSVTPDCL